MKPLYLKFVNIGVANRFELEDHELIEMNHRLKMYPELFYEVLIHEVGHIDGNYKPMDFIHDMKSRTPGLFKFMGNHISAWTQVLPLYWDNKRKMIIYDISAIASWTMIIALSLGIFLSLGWIL